MNVYSYLETLDVDTGERVILKKFDEHIEAPNWTPDGKSLIYNSKGLIYRFDLEKKSSEPLNTGICTNCNNDHVVAFDGSFLAVSHMDVSNAGFSSKIYIVPMEGGEAELVSDLSPSFLHGISPDGRTFAYCGMREGGVNIYITQRGSTGEVQLTEGDSYDDGPEYSPDGRYIWYNSTKSGLMQIWRMNTDGNNQTQMTFDESNSWFPHISPDGKRVVYLTYAKGDLEPREHVANKNVELRLMPADGGEYKTIAKLFGGQGTINVNSWAPDSKHIAFVSYKLKED